MDIDVVHVALSPWDLSDEYNRHVGTTLVSILDNCPKKVVVHLLYEEKFSLQNPLETEHNLNNYRELGTRYGTEILLHPVELPEWVTDPKRENLQHFTPGTLLRLYLPNLLPDLEKVIYLDCDMVVTADISKLWDIPLGNHSLGACLDAARASNVKYYRDVHEAFGVDWKCYFNAGLLVMNLIKLRETRMFPDRVMDLIYQHPNLPYLDQDVLNILFQKDAYFLSQRYNLPVGKRMMDYKLMRHLGISGSSYADCILHFNGRVKPWKAYSGPVDELYWKYFAMTPWGADPNVYHEAYYAAKNAKRGFVDGGIDWMMGTRWNWIFRMGHSYLEHLMRILKSYW